MGNRASSTKQSKSRKLYVPVAIRTKYRFESNDPAQAVITQDAVTDKSEVRKGKLDAFSDWKKIIPGIDDIKTEALKHLEKVWDRFHKPEKNWKAIVREAIIDQLTSRAGLQLHKITMSGFIFCRIRAPIKLLELQARREGYRLQFRGEIDPGSEKFWNLQDKWIPKDHIGDTPELEEDRRQYSKEEANQILGRLHRAGKISPMDMSVNPIKETKRMWSRRVHALERMADKVPVWNRYPAFHPYLSDTRLRYLFQTYPSVRGKTLFRSKDRLYLTKAIIDLHFDMGKLVEDGLVESFMALHDANRGEALTIETLQRRWCTFWGASLFEVGSPLVTDEAYEEDVPVWWGLRPFSQPLGNIRDYMGEKLALHFAWLGSYTYNMILPALVGLALAVYQLRTGLSEAHRGVDYYQVAFFLFLVYWCVYNKTLWSQQEVAISLKWGTRGFEAAEKDRPQFQGYPAKPLVRSVVNNRRITNFPTSVRLRRQMSSMVIVSAAIVVLISMVASVYYLDFVFKTRGYIWGSTFCSILSAVQINVFSYIYGIASRYLNDCENHRTDTAYEDNLIFKTFVFEIFNNFSALTYTAFFKGNLFNACTNGDCVGDIQQLLMTLYVIRYVMHVVAFLEPTIKGVVSACVGRRQVPLVGSEGEADGMGRALSEASSYVQEFYRTPDDGTYDNYADCVLQYGYLVLFSPTYPLIFALSLGDNLVSMRKNAWKQCAVLRRPDVLLAEDVGMWKEIMDYLTVLGIYYNVAIFVWTGRSLADSNMKFKLLFFFLGSQVLLMVRTFLDLLLGGLPTWIKQLEARQQFIIKKHLEGAEDLDDSSAVEKSEVLPEEVDVDGKSLYDFRNGAKMTKTDLKLGEELERKRRRLQSQLHSVRSALEDAYATETFNAQLGMGETKDGIPLGLLTVKVVSWQCSDSSFGRGGSAVDNENTFSGLCVKCSVVYNDVGVAVERGRVSDKAESVSASTSVVRPRAIDDQDAEGLVAYFDDGRVVGPFTAIRTIHADLRLELVVRTMAGEGDVEDGLGDRVVAVGTKPLSDLSDQQLRVNTVVVMKHGHEKALSALVGRKVSSSMVTLDLQLQYSKIAPMRERVVQLQSLLLRTEEFLSQLKSGQMSRDDHLDLLQFLKPEEKADDEV